ncbi:MAG TPA: HEAT repeat domain-containing protein [Candidatus Solibacter sp.]|nr:HEAT repeat domain-containing protein [Candidatus Solibacter sp.]
MKKPDPVEQALDRLSTLRSGDGPPSEVAQELKRFLGNRSSLVSAKAAKIAGELRSSQLVPDLVAAFERLMADPHKLDKGCAALTEIVAALYEMDYLEPEIYLKGMHHVQMEGAFGPPVDAAAKLRGLSALGLARTRHPYALDEIVALLVDPWPRARIGAVRALASNGGEAGALLLKLKIMTGDDEPDVIAECFSGLLVDASERSLLFVAKYADAEDPAIAEAAILAIGSSRLPAAFDRLKEKWERSVGAALKRVLLLAMAMTKSEAAIAFLISLLEGSNAQTAKDTITALAIYRDNEKIRRSIEDAITRRGDKNLIEALRREF